MFPISLIGDEQRNKLTCNPATHTPSSPGSTKASGLSAASVAGISIACIIVVVLILIGIYLVRNRFRDHMKYNSCTLNVFGLVHNC